MEYVIIFGLIVTISLLAIELIKMNDRLKSLTDDNRELIRLVRKLDLDVFGIDLKLKCLDLNIKCK